MTDLNKAKAVVAVVAVVAFMIGMDPIGNIENPWIYGLVSAAWFAVIVAVSALGWYVAKIVNEQED